MDVRNQIAGPDLQPRHFTAENPRTIAFGGFRLLASKRLLLEGDAPVSIGSRALDILITLLECRGDLISKEELMRRVWPDTHVVEGNLTVHIAALRRVLRDGRNGQRYIVNVPGRGYRFVAPVDWVAQHGEPPPDATEASRHNLPLRLTPLVGRDDIVQHLAEQVLRQRFISLTGPGGIGKSSVAIAVGERLAASYREGVWRVDLVSVTDPDQIAAALARTLGLDVQPEDPLSDLGAILHNKQMLLILDNCGHIVDGARSAAIRLLQAAPGLHILSTSREALRAEGEYLHRLAPLGSPPEHVPMSVETALRFPAVGLFMQYASAASGTFEMTDADVPLVAEICRKLDGIPLAIQLAASRVGIFGIRALAEQVCECPALLVNRAAAARHQTMAANLDWSYGLLTEDEKPTFRRLGIFAGSFTLEEAVIVVSDGTASAVEIINRIAELVVKSLLVADVAGPEPRLSMHQTTRAYAVRKLTESREFDVVAHRHRELISVYAGRSTKDTPHPTEQAYRLGTRVSEPHSVLRLPLRTSRHWRGAPGDHDY